jgi:hypothetical protein
MKKLLGGLTAALILFASCGKDDDEETTTTLNKLQHKWQVESIVFNTGSTPINYPGSSNDYADFRTDGKLYLYFGGKYDTSTYSLYKENKLIRNSDTANINELTDTKLVFFGKQAISPGVNYEATFNLKR